MLIKCPECGKEISDKVALCPNCGAPITEIVIQQSVTNEKEQCSDTSLGLWGGFLKYVVMLLVIGGGLAGGMILVFNADYDLRRIGENISSVFTTSNRDTQYDDRRDIINSPISPRAPIYFRNELDVRRYLMSHTFISEDGKKRIRFELEAHQMISNGTVLSSETRISAIENNNATMRVYGPFGTSRFSVWVGDDNARGLVDQVSYIVYKEE